jgi:hypothetical protein
MCRLRLCLNHPIPFLVVSWLSPFPHPIDGDARRPAQAAGQCGRVMLDVPDVDDLVFQGRHLVPGKAALLGGEIQRIDATVDQGIAFLAVFQKVNARKRLARLGWTVSLPRNAAYELCFVSMTSPRTKSLLSLLQVKVSIE